MRPRETFFFFGKHALFSGHVKKIGDRIPLPPTKNKIKIISMNVQISLHLNLAIIRGSHKAALQSITQTKSINK